MSDVASNELAVSARVGFAAFTLDVDTAIRLDGVTGVFGPSGSGKSTLLRILAGLERNAEGSIRFGADVWQDSSTRFFVEPHRRPVGFVFQDARLFSHLDVAGNLRFAMRRAGEGAIDYDEVVTTMSLEHLLQRRTDTLSGGERQRVAIARTLLGQPRLLLFDEPMASLDEGHKREILPYLENIHGRFGVPAVYVSHSAREMAHVADRVIVLESGRLTATGNVAEVLGRDASLPIELPFEPITVLDVDVVDQRPGLHLTRVSHEDQRLTIPEVAAASAGDRLRLVIRAGDVILARQKPQDISVRNVLEGEVVSIDVEPDTAFVMVSVAIGDATLKAQLTQHAVDELGLKPGIGVYALIKTATFDRPI